MDGEDVGTRELEKFLKETFSTSELRTFIARVEPTMMPELPDEKASLTAHVEFVVGALQRRGRLDHDLFDALLVERPRFNPRINRLRLRCLPGGELTAGTLWRRGELRLLEEIKVGGFAEVWSACDTRTNRKVALKILHKEKLGEIVQRMRFLRGAQVLHDHPHRNLVKVLSSSEQEGARVYFVMEFIEGDSLDSCVATDADTTTLLRYVLQVADALVHLHADRILHRDVKPGNVMVDKNGVAKLIDLDLVEAEAAAFSDLTDAPLGGTRRFAPPEAFERSGKQRFAPAFDVYSLAQMVVFVLSRGELPIEGATTELRPEWGAEMCKTLDGALHSDPGARTPSVADFTAGLRLAYPALLPAKGEAHTPAVPARPKLAWGVRWRRLLAGLRRWGLWLLGSSVGLTVIVVGLCNLLRPLQLLDTRPFQTSGTYAPVEGCTRLEIKAWGGGGGGTTHAGGGGGYVGASFELTDRNAFDVEVGGAGGSWRVGAAGQPGGAESGPGYFHGARSGGYSVVRQAGRVFVIAGGGGGAGGAGPGGGGGGTTGESGRPQDRGGSGGSQVEGGLGGGHVGDGEDGHRGSRNTGGQGGRANPERGGGGGGGGGGHYGGGGGGGDNLYILHLNDGSADAGSGGGGGGSGWLDANAAVPGTQDLETARGADPPHREDYVAPAGQGGCCTNANGRQTPNASGEGGLVVLKCWG